MAETRLISNKSEVSKIYFPKELFNNITDWVKANHIDILTDHYSALKTAYEINYNYLFPVSTYQFYYGILEKIEFNNEEDAIKALESGQLCSTVQFVKADGSVSYLSVPNSCKTIVRKDNIIYVRACLTPEIIKSWDCIGIDQYYSGNGIPVVCTKWQVWWVSPTFTDEQNLTMTREHIIEMFNRMEKVTTTKTYKLGPYGLSLLTDEDKKIATDKGWTLE